MHPSYGNTLFLSSKLRLTLIATWFSSKHLCKCIFPSLVFMSHPACFGVIVAIFSSHGVTCLSQRSQYGNGIGCSSNIRILFLQRSLLNWFFGTLLLRDVLGLPGNGHWHDCILVGNLTSYTTGRYSIYLTGRQSQSITVYFPCNCLRWDVMGPIVNYTPQYGHGMLYHRIS